MKYVAIQTVDCGVSSELWRELVRRYVREGATLQLRCWSEESDEIAHALRYGASHKEGLETCIDGVVSGGFLEELLTSPEPRDKELYNKMTPYFTLRVTDGGRVFESSHYGTELYLVLPEEDAAQVCDLLRVYGDGFSVSVGEA